MRLVFPNKHYANSFGYIQVYLSLNEKKIVNCKLNFLVCFTICLNINAFFVKEKKTR